ncbi:UDP-N-acetylmuramoylalanine--D-glutamate ligase [Alicyclobacillus cellulosilyticus]|uniref:UDP-N-acetylmuramoylalanine--D-glutamate ligase n=2 Tax=Alicyclobacillus cellulosilyticus TaxID=1003997 RepID=A0A917NF50_9BACL|nr:UDP-N-acetylmuramoylalanine--D-glutamate ligase [Alicyclobacillus cellulosilyticus]
MRPVAGERILVMGWGKSGEAAARLLLAHGARVTVTEQRPRQADDHAANELEALGAQLVFGEHPLSLLSPPPAFLVKNPGIPYHIPFVQEAMRRGIPVVTEVEVASWFLANPIYAITGSNGKTTTTTLVGEILTAAGLEPVVAGNIGRALCSVVGEVRPWQPLVVEVSSFQLAGTETFHPRIGALLNLYPAHLDYHGTFEQYAEAKRRLFRNMGPDDVAVLNADQPRVANEADRLQARVVWFGRHRDPGADGVYLHGETLVVRRGGVLESVLPVTALALPGAHNLENALAATAIAVWAGAPLAAVRHVLTRFRGVEHRLEFVRTVRGIDFYNDSKATNPSAALPALRSFQSGVVWIAGGLDRGDDFSALLPELSRVKAAILLGQAAPRLAAVCRAAGVPAVEEVPSLEAAVHRAMRHAMPGDVVLLSPACASWDMFPSFEVRGRMFKDLVHTL